MVGLIFGDHEVLEESGRDVILNVLYKVRCIKCGNIKVLPKTKITHLIGMKHSNKFCGIYLSEYDPFIGNINGDRQIVRLDRITNHGYRYITKCLVCGREKSEYISNFKRSFGVDHSFCTRLIIKDRYYKRINKIHSCMIQRCSNPNYNEFYLYGGRGITVDSSWNYFVNFYDDMYESYVKHVIKYGEKNTSIDRIDVNNGYNKNNCRWATCKEQSNNKRNNKLDAI